MLLVADDERLFLYNESARRIWDAVAAGLNPDEVAGALAAANGLHRDTIRADVDRMIAQWQANDLLADASSRFRVADPLPLPRGPPAWAAEWTCRIRGRLIGFAVQDPSHAYLLKLLLQHWETQAAEPEMRIEVRDAGAGRSVIIQDGQERARISGAIGLRGTVHAAIVEYLWPDRPISALVHGGAVAIAGTGICLPAFAGSGKTTLIAHLIARGFSYLGDDLTPVDGTGCMLPWPTPLSVKEGSWQLLAELHPSLADQRPYRTVKGMARLLIPPAAADDAAPMPLNLLVFPQFEKGAPTGIETLRPFQALERLYKAGIWLGHPLSKEKVGQFLAWLERTPAYALSYGNLDEAERQIVGLVATDAKAQCA